MLYVAKSVCYLLGYDTATVVGNHDDVGILRQVCRLPCEVLPNVSFERCDITGVYASQDGGLGDKTFFDDRRAVGASDDVSGSYPGFGKPLEELGSGRIVADHAQQGHLGA